MGFPTRAPALLLALIAAAAGCSSDDLVLPEEGLPAALGSVSGGGQTGTVAAPLPDSLKVRVTDSESRPVEGVKVVFTPLLGGGDAVPDTGLTNADGRTGTRWLLGTTAGAQRMQAMVVGPTSGGALTQNFDATALAAAADTVFIGRGNNQSAEVGATLADSLVVRVTDQYGNSVSGTAVTWAATGGGTVSPVATTTGATGTAAAERTLGPNAGPQGATATAGTLKGSPVTFAMTARPASAASLIKVSGDAQTGPAGFALPDSLVVRLLDASGNGVPGSNVTFAVAPSSGATSPTSVTTDANGRAATRWTLGPTAGNNSLIATSPGVPQVTFQATGTFSTATTLAANSATAQGGTAGLPVAAPPSVRVTDANGNPVAGVSISFAVTAGGGSALPVTPVVTNASGIASLTSWTLGIVAGGNTVTASAAGLSPSSIAFTATGAPGAATQLQIVTQPSPAAQSGVPLAVQPVVRLADTFGNAVTTGAPVTVTATLASGPGTLGGTTAVATSGGVATFSNLAITGPTGAYTLQFASPGLTSVTSTAVAIGAGVATRLAIATEPSTTAASGVAFAQQPAVQLQDGAGNPVAQGGVTITAAIGTGGGTLGGTATATTNSGGLATFAGLSITGAVGPRTLSFTSGSLTAVSSGTITLSAGAATQMAINAGNGQSATVNTNVATAPSVIVRDASNNPVAGVAVTFAVTGGGGSIVPVTPVVTNAAGVAALTSWRMGTVAGANALSATAGSLTGSPLTFTATGTVAAAAQLQIVTQPSPSAQSGVSLAVQPVVRLADAFGNPVTTGGAVTVNATLASGPGTLGGTVAVSTVAGVATYTNLAITGSTGAYTIQFAATGLGNVTSNTVAIGAGVATRLAMVTQPSATAQSGVVLAQQPAVRLEDGAGNPVATNGVVVTVAIGTGGGTLGGTATASTDPTGVATFAGLSIAGTVGARTLTFSSGALTPVNSAAIAVSAGAATQMAINAGNGQTGTVNTALATDPSVVVRDASGNPVAGVAVTFAVTGGGGSIVPVTPVVTNAAGLATLTSWTLGTVAGANTLNATAGGLTGSPLAFTATGTAGAATQLQMATQPSPTAQSGAPLAVQPAVRLADAFGNLVATNGTTITAAIGSGTGTLGGTATANTAAGVATFTNLSLTGGASAFTLRFTAGALTAATSNTITLGAGAATQLAIVVQPSAAVQNAIAFAQQPQVQVQDAAGNPVAGVRAVTVSILAGGGALGGTATVNTNAAGLVTFAGLSITGVVGSRTLNFASTGLTSVVSTAVVVSAGLPTQMTVSTGNSQTATAGASVATPPRVLVRDVSNNPVAGVAVTFAVATGGGSVVPSTPVATDASGLAAVTSWTLGTVAGANSLTATAAPGGITGNPVTFTATGVAGSAGRLAMFTQPSGSAASGASLAQPPVVQLQDVNGNPVTTAGIAITAMIASGPGGSLGGSAIAATDGAGRATFTGLSITGPTGSYTLQFSGTSLTGITSSAITLTAGAATRVTVVTQPTSAQSGIAMTALTVQVQDAAGNPVGGAPRNISVLRLAGTATLTGTTSQATNAAGLATFPNLVLTGTAGPNTLLFSSAGLTADESGTIDLTAGNASQLTIEQQPSASSPSGVALAQQPTVQVRDASGNPVSGVRSVTVAIASGGGTLGGTATVNTNAAGLATFAGLSITGTVGARTLQFTSTGLTAATSTAVTITAGAATQLTMVQQPSATAQNGVAFAQQPTVQVRDASGNPVSGMVAVTAAILTGGGTLGGVATVNTNGAGLATFAGLSITGPVGARTLQFTATGLTAATSGTVTTTAGAPTQMAVNAGNAQSATVNSAVTTAPSVIVRDASNNPVQGVSVIFAVTGGGGAVLPATAVTTNAAGVATSTSWTLGATAGPNTLSATAAPGGITPNPVTFTATGTPGPATQLTVEQDPSASAPSGVAFAQQPTVQVRDASGNPVSGVRPVTVAIASGGGTLGGTATVNTDAAGLATFAGLSITGTVGARTLQFTSAGLTAATSAAISITAGAATQLTMVQQPSATAQNGVAFAQQPTVQVRDASGNPVSGVVSVTAAILTGGGTLGGVATVNTNATGLATFAGLSITGTAGARTLQFTSGALTPATSGTVTTTAGAPTQMAINAGNAQSATVNSAVATAPSVVVRDASNNPVSGVSVTFAVTGGGGAVLPVGAVVTNASGIAAATSWTLGSVAGANTLTATAAPGGITPNPATFTATGTPGAATQLTIEQQPSASAQSGVAFAQQPAVQVRDASGNPVSGVRAVTVAIATGGGTLGGTATVNSDAAGLATFAGLSITGTVGARTLQFTSTGLAAATSSAVTITAGAATQLAVIQQPSATAQNGVAFAQQPTVQVRDASGNPVSGVVAVTAAIATGGGTLGGTATVNTDVTGLATFAGLSITGPVGARSLQFTAAGLTAATSGTITISAGAATALAVVQQPSATAQSGVALAQPPTVRAEDASGNPVAGVRAITVAILSGGGTLGGVTTVNSDAAGLATFAGLSISGTVGTRTLQFTSTGLASATSGSITVAAGAPTQMAINAGNAQSATVGSAVAIAPSVVVRDAAGNPVAGVAVTFAVTGGGGAVLPVGAVATNASGIATATSWTLGSVAGPNALSATAAPGGITPNPVAFTATGTAGVATQLAIIQQPSATAQSGVAFAQQPTVQVRDAAGNPVAGVRAVTVAILTGGGALGGTATTNTDAAGLATFAGLSITGTVGARTLQFTSTGLTAVTSSAISITAGAATQLAVIQQPSATAPSGAVLAQQPTVQVRDASGNPVGGVRSVAVAIATGGGTLGGAASVDTDAGGLATFAGLSIAGTTGARTLEFTSTGLTAATSTAIAITPGAPAALAFSGQPTGTTVGAVITPAVTVRIVDASGNTTASTATVALAFGANPGTAALGGTTSLAAVAGVATFNSLTVSAAGAGYTLAASSTGLTGATSAAFTIGAGATTTTITSDLPDPSVSGQPVTVNFTVTSPGGTPTGNVTVSDGTINCVATVAVGNCALSFPTAGARSLTATYAGDANFTTSASAPVAHAVNPAATAPVVGTHTPDPSPRGTAVTISWAVPVVAPGSGTPTGNVTAGDGVNSCVAAVAAGSCSVALTTVGARQLTAAYAGDANFAAATSPPVAHVVSPGVTTTTISNDTPDPSVVGQLVTVNYSVTGPAGTPTGNVTVSDGAGASCVGTVAAGSCALAFATPGARTLTATYAGDANYLTSASAGAPHGVNQAATTTVINTNTPNPSPRGTPVNVTWSVPVTAPGAGTPTGNVTVSDGVDNCVAAVALGGCAVTLNTVGARTLTATYAGDANFAGSTSAGVGQGVTAAASTTTITGDAPDPSVTGQSVTVTYTVTGAGGTPTGNVTVSDGLGSSCIGTVAAGQCALTFPSAGARTLTASYAGDGNYSNSASAGTAHQVNAAATTTTMGVPNPTPSSRGESVAVTWSVGVVGPGAGTPAGNVTVGDGVDSCVAPVAAGGCSVALTTVGARTLTATYAGNANFAGSASAGAPHTVTQGVTVTTIVTDNPDPSVTGQPVTVTFTVTGPAGTPIGNVNVSDGGSASCAATVAVGQCVLAFPTAGLKSLTAAYGGDANYQGGLSAPVSHQVNPAATTTTLLTHTPDPSTTAEAVNVTWSVVALAPGAGTPTGNVTVSDGVDSCTADATAGGCTIPALTTTGTRTLVATYAGSPNFAGSASAGTSHIVN